jgi:hypothetical protein
MLRFADYFGPSQLRHRLGIRKIPVPLSSIARMPSDCWKEYFVSVLSEKCVSQVSVLRSTPKASLINSLYLSASLGVCYVNKGESCLEATNGKISVEDFEAFIGKNRKNRKKFERAEFSAEQHKQQELKRLEFRMSAVEPQFSTSLDTRPVQEIPKSLKRNKTLVTGYYPGVYDYAAVSCLNESAASVNDWVAGDEASVKRLAEVLVECGFEHTQSISEPRYKVTFSVSTSYSVDVRLNSDLSLKSIYQKPLTWVHATVLDGLVDPAAPPKSSHHIRITMQTSESIESESDLFLVVYPDKVLGTKQSPIELGEDGIAEPSKLLKQESRYRITHIRQVTYSEEFRNEQLRGFISRGYNISYSRDKLLTKAPFCELSLCSSEATPLKNWLQQSPYSSFSDTKIWFDSILGSIIDVSQLLSKCEI